jgi:site-specific recombinase XerD
LILVDIEKDFSMQEIEVSRPVRLTLDQCIREWLAVKAGRSESAKTKEAYEDTLTDFRTRLQSAGFDLDSDPDTIATLAQGYAGFSTTKERVSSSTHNQRLSILSSFYKHAIKRRVVTVNPIDFTDRRKIKTEDAARPIPVQEVKSGLLEIDRNTLEGKRDYAILAMLLETGRRVSEVAALTYGSIQRQGKTATVIFKRCKGNKKMIDTLPPTVTSAVFDYLIAVYGSNPPSKDAPVWVSFSNRGKGQAISARTIERICDKYMGTSKAHATRHTWAIEMKNRGADITQIQKGLGHSNLQTTTIYMEELTGYENPFAAALADVWGIK